MYKMCKKNNKNPSKLTPVGTKQKEGQRGIHLIWKYLQSIDKGLFDISVFFFLDRKLY